MAVIDGSWVSTGYQRGNTGSMHVFAVDGTRHPKVADCSAIEQNERGAVVVNSLYALRIVLTPVVGQRVTASVEGAVKGERTCTSIDAVGINVVCHLKERALVAVTHRYLDGKLLPVGTALNLVGIGLRSAAVPCPHVLNCYQ